MTPWTMALRFFVPLGSPPMVGRVTSYAEPDERFCTACNDYRPSSEFYPNIGTICKTHYLARKRANDRKRRLKQGAAE